MGIPTTKVSFKVPTFRRLRIRIALKSKFSNCYPADNKRGISNWVLTSLGIEVFEAEPKIIDNNWGVDINNLQ